MNESNGNRLSIPELENQIALLQAELRRKTQPARAHGMYACSRCGLLHQSVWGCGCINATRDGWESANRWTIAGGDQKAAPLHPSSVQAVDGDENAKLRQLLCDVLTALGNGSGASPACSMEFLSGIPEEVRLHVAALRDLGSHQGKGEPG